MDGEKVSQIEEKVRNWDPSNLCVEGGFHVLNSGWPGRGCRVFVSPFIAGRCTASTSCRLEVDMAN